MWHFVQPSLVYGWDTAEFSHSATTSRATIISDAITIKKITVWVATAPGAGVTRTFLINNQSVDTAASVAITGSATTATWTGSVDCAAGTRVTWKTVVSGGTAAASGGVHLLVEYETAGNFYLMTNMQAGTPQNLGRQHPMIGQSGLDHRDLDSQEMICPTGITITKIGLIGMSNGMGSGVGVYFRKGGTGGTTSVTTTFTALEQALTMSTPFAVAAGQALTEFVQPSGDTAWQWYVICLTVVPDNPGEQITGYGTASSALGTTGTNYHEPEATLVADATEANRYHRLPACIIRNLYVKLTSAPGTSASRTITARVAGVDSAMTVTVANANTLGNDTAHSVSVNQGDLVSVKQVPTATPADSFLKFGFVVYIPQATTQFFSMF